MIPIIKPTKAFFATPKKRIIFFKFVFRGIWLLYGFSTVQAGTFQIIIYQNITLGTFHNNVYTNVRNIRSFAEFPG